MSFSSEVSALNVAGINHVQKALDAAWITCLPFIKGDGCREATEEVGKYVARNPIGFIWTLADIVSILTIARWLISWKKTHTLMKVLRYSLQWPVNVIFIVLVLPRHSWGRDTRWVPRWDTAFMTLLVAKIIRVLCQFFSYHMLNSPHRTPLHPSIIPSDVTVIITLRNHPDDPFDHLVGCITSVWLNKPKEIIFVVTEESCLPVVQSFVDEAQEAGIRISMIGGHSRNTSPLLSRAVEKAKSRIIAFVDGEQVSWKFEFLKYALAPLEDDEVALVGTSSEAIPVQTNLHGNGFFQSVLVFLRNQQDFENSATYNIDGGVRLLPSHTILVRSQILRSKSFWNSVLAVQKNDYPGYVIPKLVKKRGYKVAFQNATDTDGKPFARVLIGNYDNAKFRSYIMERERASIRDSFSQLLGLIYRFQWLEYLWTTFTIATSPQWLHGFLLFATLFKAGYGYKWCTLFFAYLFLQLFGLSWPFWLLPWDITRTGKKTIFPWDVTSNRKLWIFPRFINPKNIFWTMTLFITPFWQLLAFCTWWKDDHDMSFHQNLKVLKPRNAVGPPITPPNTRRSIGNSSSTKDEQSEDLGLLFDQVKNPSLGHLKSMKNTIAEAHLARAQAAWLSAVSLMRAQAWQKHQHELRKSSFLWRIIAWLFWRQTTEADFMSGTMDYLVENLDKVGVYPEKLDFSDT